MNTRHPHPRTWRHGALGLVAVATLGMVAMSGEDDQIQLQIGESALFEPGTQPETNIDLFKPILSSTNCAYCHSDFDVETAPYDSWITSLMGQSARDPIWHAALSIANQDIQHGGETCIRCHAPNAWLSGKSGDGLIDDFDATDYEGINCNFCHRAVNP
ncbi:MAG: multiheme c-type cytochrome [Planctomycetota bacterium]|nr:multiheme c-type cytochrome [Planctomycetota bacterium]